MTRNCSRFETVYNYRAAQQGMFAMHHELKELVQLLCKTLSVIRFVQTSSDDQHICTDRILITRTFLPASSMFVLYLWMEIKISNCVLSRVNPICTERWKMRLKGEKISLIIITPLVEKSSMVVFMVSQLVALIPITKQTE